MFVERCKTKANVQTWSISINLTSYAINLTPCKIIRGKVKETLKINLNPELNSSYRKHDPWILLFSYMGNQFRNEAPLWILMQVNKSSNKQRCWLSPHQNSNSRLQKNSNILPEWNTEDHIFEEHFHANGTSFELFICRVNIFLNKSKIHLV